MKLVIDTSILIDHLRGGKIWNDLLKEIKEKDVELYMPTIVIFELFSGQSSKDSAMMKKIYRFLENFKLIELTEDIARRVGEIYRDISVTLQVPDYVIAASTLEINGEVVTLNIKHFEKIPNLKIYPL